MQTDGTKFRLWVPCGVCGGQHQAECSADALLQGRGIGLSCPVKQELCCYVGQEQDVRRAMENLALRVEKDKGADGEAFTDSVIMYEVLSELKDIAARGGISCTCGSTRYTVQVRRGAVDLVCADCGGRLRLARRHRRGSRRPVLPHEADHQGEVKGRACPCAAGHRKAAVSAA